MIRRVRLAVEGVGWFAVGVVVLAFVDDRYPAVGCRLLGHVPADWTWDGVHQQESACRYCETKLVRDVPPADRAFAA